MVDRIGALNPLGQEALFAAQQKRLEAQLKQAQGLGTEGLNDSLTKAQRQQAGEIERAATQFEAIFVKQMLDSMWAAVPQNGLLSGSREEGFYRDMLNDALAEQLARSQSIGIKEVVMKELGDKSE